MASPNIYENGAGGTSGDELATFSNLRLSGEVWYVHFTNGTDAASPAGKERIKPLKTLAQAHTNAAAGDAIVLLSGHAETLIAAQTFNKAGVRLVSEGASGTSAAARFTCNNSVAMFDITAAGVVLGGIYFPASTAAANPARVRIASSATVVRGCYFECGSSDTVPALQYVTGAGTARLINTTFVSTATASGTQPHSAVNVLNAMSDLTLDTVVFDGGASGWSQPFAFNGGAAVTRLTATTIDLLNDSDVTLATGSVYTWHIRARTGSARVVLAA